MSDIVIIKNETTERIEKACERRLPNTPISVSKPSEKLKGLCLIIKDAKPANRTEFKVIREESLKEGYDIVEDVDLKGAEDVNITSVEMYYYLLVPIETLNQNK